MAQVIKKATRESFGMALCELAKTNKDIIVFDADLAAATKTGIFKKEFPERFFDCGIAEGNMVGVAAGYGSGRQNSGCHIICNVCNRQSI